MAPQKIVLTKEQIEQAEIMAGFGLPEDKIATVLGVSPKTLQRRKRDQEKLQEAMKSGRAKAEMAVARTLYKMAVEDRNLSAVIWYEKTRCGRSDRSQLEIIRAVEQELELTLDKLEAIMPPDEYANLLDYLAAIEGSEATEA